ncbi:MAG TPA: bifunctional ADP-dependent NAD(P)H-hydrate dehydratase/NAD(P)H-hydrate epimerase, partial [Candidatus Egerieimonas faecigallinarum]|nr:bifunctional ADP-dependent NAD(P)H-hydrate dehydratase/NAD(P)H-hydrate epimerase [Candidatus Egerieimonas faecigallinarum]
MRYVLTDEQMKACDSWTISQMGVPSLVLMERAALACVSALHEEGFDLTRVLAVCGTGNNGADGAAAARILYLKGVNAEIYLAGDPAKYSPDLK